MKNSLRFYSVFFIVIVAFALDGCAPKSKVVPGTKQIVLVVDTENIKPGSDAKDYCSFPDQQAGVPIADYTTGVKPGDPIVWLGVSKSAPLEDKVSIEMINYMSGNKVYGGPRQGQNGKVEGKISDDVEPGQEETYVIKFKVIKEGSPPNNYDLDPKLRVH